MVANCKVCEKELSHDSDTAHRIITNGICDWCAAQVSGASDNSAFLESVDAPVLLMQGNPRQVVSANRRALSLFAKDPHEVEGRRGGQVFDCIHSFTEAGCGKDVNCENCKIKNAIVGTFTDATSRNGVATQLSINKAGATNSYVLQVSTEKIGDLALVRIERYDTDA